MMHTSVRSPPSARPRVKPEAASSAPQGSGDGIVRVSPTHLLMLALLACVVAATLGAKPLAAWVDASLLSGTLVQSAVDEWSDAMERIGVTRPYDVLRHAIRDAEAARFPGRD